MPSAQASSFDFATFVAKRPRRPGASTSLSTPPGWPSHGLVLKKPHAEISLYMRRIKLNPWYHSSYLSVTFHIPAYVLPDNGAEPVASYWITFGAPSRVHSLIYPVPFSHHRRLSLTFRMNYFSLSSVCFIWLYVI